MGKLWAFAPGNLWGRPRVLTIANDASLVTAITLANSAKGPQLDGAPYIWKDIFNKSISFQYLLPALWACSFYIRNGIAQFYGMKFIFFTA
jgi:hypothetical protein